MSDTIDTIEFDALCPACGQDSLWSNGLQIVDYPAGREYVLTTTCHCPCDQPKDTPCAAS